MSTGTETASQKQVTEIRIEGTNGGDQFGFINVPVGSEIRIAFSSTVGIGPHNYDVQSSGSVESVRQDLVSEVEPGGRRKVGALRTDVVLSAKSTGKGSIKVRTLDEQGVEHAVTTVDFTISEDFG